MRSFILFAAGGLCVAASLLACARAKQEEDPQVLQREEFAARTFREIDAGRAWGMSSKSDVQFDEGWSMVMFDPPNQELRPSFYNHSFRWLGQHAHVRLKAHPGRRMRLAVGGWVHENVIRTHPVVEAFVDGFYLGGTPVLRNDGHFLIEAELPEWMLRREWVDLIVKTNAVGFHWGEPPNLNTVLVYRFEWSEAGPTVSTQ